MTSDSDPSHPSNWDWAQMEPELSEREKQLRDVFCTEYLVDRNAFAAAQRCGFQFAFAKDYAVKFMQESYVQKRIKELEQFNPEVGKDDKADSYNKNRVREALLAQAFYNGPGSSHAARVSALKALAVIYGMEAPQKTESTVTHRGGVLMVPMIADVNNWEDVAQASQQKLLSDARH